MKKLLIFSIFLISLFLISCNSNDNNNEIVDSNQLDYSSEVEESSQIEPSSSKPKIEWESTIHWG